MKKLASLLLALVMIMSCFSAMAASGINDDSGKITINDAVANHTYEIYQILSLESYNTETGAYAYKATEAWKEFVASATDYLKVDAAGYVTWINTDSANNGTAVAAFAKKALAYADANGIAAVQTKKAETNVVEFTNLNLGYYLIDTTLGTLCSLDTTNTSVEMFEKNEEPTTSKQVQEESTGAWGDTNTAEVGDTVNFRTFVNAKPGAVNYVLHDTMEAGLTLLPATIAIEGLTKGEDYTVSTTCTDDCTFEITFTKSYLDSITAATTLTVTYSAILNDKAEISTEHNDNTTHLTYGDLLNGEPQFSTTSDTTETFTFQFDLVKTNSKNELLEGAKFELYDAKTEGAKIPLVKESKGVYRVATDAEIDAEGFTSAVIEGSKAIVEGLDADTTYWLEEIEAPNGYNKLTERVEVKIENANLTANVLNNVWQEGGVHVVNQTGTELPSTGGMGTTILYVGGGILVLAAIVLLIAKRRTAA